jgi:hypothetical protein
MEGVVLLGQPLPDAETCDRSEIWCQVLDGGRVELVRLRRATWAHASPEVRRAHVACTRDGQLDRDRLREMIAPWPTERKLHLVRFWYEVGQPPPAPVCPRCQVPLAEGARPGPEPRLPAAENISRAQELREQTLACLERSRALRGRARG